MSFDSTKNTLEKLLEQVDEGSLQLPEFQRDYVWTGTGERMVENVR